MQPKTDDPAQQQSNLILKILPLMIGWFSLNVPAALTVYWVVNNIITTATSLIVKNTMKVEPVVATGSGGATATAPNPADSIFAPPREKPSGFAPMEDVIDAEEVKPITSSPSTEEVDADVVSDAAQGMAAPKKSKKKKRGKKRKKN